MTTSTERLLRADIALSNLASNGGLLLPEQANQFIDFVVEQPTMLAQVRQQRMNGPQMKINRLGFDSRIMHAATQTGGQNDSGSNDRWLAAAKRSKPLSSQIQLDTKEYIAEVRIPYEVMEDNIEQGNFEEHVLRQMAARAALDFEEFAIFSDTGSGDADLLVQDGWLKRITSNVLDNASAGPKDSMVTAALLAIPQRYLRNLPAMRMFLSIANKIKFQADRINRIGALGDQSAVANVDLYSQGVKIEPTATMASDGVGAKGIFTYPQNLVFGIQRQITVETDKDIRSREYIIVVTARIALQVDDQVGALKLINV
jgi:hypothetical protein